VPGVQRLTCRVVALEPASRDIRILRLALPKGARFDFRAGQYAALGFGELPARDFSMASRPGEAPLEFHVQQMNQEGASGYVASRLAPGEAVSLEGPYGEAWLRSEHEGPILAVAGGSGLAPIKSIIETALALGVGQPIHLYFGAAEEDGLYLAAHFEALARRHPNLRFVPVLSAPQGDTRRRRGLVTEAIAEDFPDLTGFKVYLAGPTAMAEAALALLRERALPEADIHADPFYTVAEKAERGLD
jgi:CDP-4-dehydro-6-deoxyglucose reductase/ferredoxin-NAD(P)+ reductase (naphthalene dioxygenase ferredoxin-specific)